MSTFPLLDDLVSKHGYPLLDEAGVDAFIADGGNFVLLFTGDPTRYPETLDVAVILPEIIKEVEGRCRVAVVERAAELTLQKRYGFTVWPALVFLRGQDYLGVIERVKDWMVYLSEVERLLNAVPRRPPTIGVPVVA